MKVFNVLLDARNRVVRFFFCSHILFILMNVYMKLISYDQWYKIKRARVLCSTSFNVFTKLNVFMCNSFCVFAPVSVYKWDKENKWTFFRSESAAKTEIERNHNALIWQKEASDKSEISRKRAKCVCHLHWRQWNIMMSYLTYLLVGWVFLHEIWPGRRAHYVNYENITNSNLDGMSLASFCQSRALPRTVISFGLFLW